MASDVIGLMDFLKIPRAAVVGWSDGAILGLEIALRHTPHAVCIVPVGDAVMKLRELIAAGKAPGLTKQTDLFTDQIGHGKEPVLALATYCNFACIYRISPAGLKAPNAALDKLSPELDPLLRQIAWDTVSTYPHSSVKPTK